MPMRSDIREPSAGLSSLILISQAQLGVEFYMFAYRNARIYAEKDKVFWSERSNKGSTYRCVNSGAFLQSPLSFPLVLSGFWYPIWASFFLFCVIPGPETLQPFWKLQAGSQTQTSNFSEHSWEIGTQIPLLVKGFVGITSLQCFENSFHSVYCNTVGAGGGVE